MKTKTCTKCKREFPFNENYFMKRNDTKSGFRATCKECLGYSFNDNNYYTKEKIINIYEDVLTGIKNKLTNNIFKNKEIAKMLIKYILEEKYKYSLEDILKLNRNFFLENKIITILSSFNNSVYELLDYVYPELKIKPWLMSSVPKNYYNNNKNVECILKWFIEQLFIDEIITDINQIPTIVSCKLFQKYGLNSFLSFKFRNSPYVAINFLYPDKWKPWEFSQVPSNYWNENTLIDAIKWLFEKKLKINIDIIPEIINRDLFINNGLGEIFYRYNFRDLIMRAYPNKFFIWQFDVAPGFWVNKNNIIDAFRDVFETIEKVNIKDIPKEYSNILKKYPKLITVRNTYFDGNTFDIFNEIYPNKFFEWEFRNCNHRWDDKNYRTKSLKELIEQKNNISIDKIPQKITIPFLMRNYSQFGMVLSTFYNYDLYQWVDECYPNKFNKKDFYKFYSHDIKMDSYEETIINDFLFDNCKQNVTIIYVGNRKNKNYIFYDEKNKSSYIPDWILIKEDKTYIIEYFGWYDNNKESYYIKNYIDKTHNKIDFFSEFCKINNNNVFISLFPNDFRSKKYKEIFKEHNLLKEVC